MESILIESAEILRKFTASWNYILGSSYKLRRERSLGDFRRNEDITFGAREDVSPITEQDEFYYSHDKDLAKSARDYEQECQRRKSDVRHDASTTQPETTKTACGEKRKKRQKSCVYYGEMSGCNLTMDVIGCLPDNIQQAIKSFSIKKETEHLTLSFPFMTEILRKTCSLGNGAAGRYVTPMILCNHSLKLTNYHQAIVTLAPDYQRSTLCVVQFTICRSYTREGLHQHYTQLLSSVLKDFTKMRCFRFPQLVVLDDTDPMMIGSLCAKIKTSLCPPITGENSNCYAHRMHETSNAEFLVSGLNREIFNQAVNETLYLLTDQDRDRFLVSIKHLLSEKCPRQEFKKTEKLLGDHELVPFAIKDFWMIWGHELIKPLIFPVAKVIWDDEVQVEDSASGSLCWRALFNPLMTIDSEGGGKNERTGGMKALIQSIVRRLRGQVPDGDVDIQDRSCTPHLCRGVCFQQPLTKFAKPSSVSS